MDKPYCDPECTLYTHTPRCNLQNSAPQNVPDSTGGVMGKALEAFMVSLRAELRVGGGATLDELYSLAEAIQADLEELTTNE